MTKEVRELQQLVSSSDEASVREWSTISHTHGGTAAVYAAQGAFAETSNSFDVNLLQQLVQAAPEAVTREWSTISHTHKVK